LATVAGHGNIIGFSGQHRPIYCLIRGRAEAPLKVLILAGQHGDERPPRRAIKSFLARPPEELAGRLPNLQLAVIPDANPDGFAVRSRCNANGIDLNRDHQLLLSAETAALHRFVRRWQPHLILDMHSYPSRRSHLLERNVVLDHDVFVDVPNHPAIFARPGCADADEVLRGLLQAIARRDVRADRYTIVKTSGHARHSTADVVDARNGLALRYGAFTILVEHRQPRREETATDRRRLRAAQERALWAVLQWLDDNHDLFQSPFRLELPAPGTSVPIHFKYRNNGNRLRLICRDAQQGRPVSVTFSRYADSLVSRRTVALPAGYAVPRELEALLAVLYRQGWVSTRCRAGDLCSVERLRIAAAHPPRRPDRSPRNVVLAPCQMNLELEPYEIFLTRQTGGEALAVHLEPESKHGLHRFVEMQIPLLAPFWYPILRVFDGPCARLSRPPPAFQPHEIREIPLNHA
jgi:hypothetical protein